MAPRIGNFPPFIHPICRNVTKKIADLIIETPNDSLILPFSDYPGPMTSEILTRRIGSLSICEPNAEKRAILSSKLNSPDSGETMPIFIYNDNILQRAIKSPYSNEDQNRCLTIFEKSLATTNYDKSYKTGQVKVLIGLQKASCEYAALRSVQNQLGFRSGFYTDPHNFAQSYCLISERLNRILKAEPGKNLKIYRATTVFYSSYFHIDSLACFDLRSGFGVDMRRIHKAKVDQLPIIHLIKLTPKTDISNIQGQAVGEYRFFLQQMLAKRSRPILVSLEKLFNIDKNYVCDQIGMNEQQKSGNLSPEQYSWLFDYIKSLKNYKHSMFMHAYESSFRHMIFPDEKESIEG